MSFAEMVAILSRLRCWILQDIPFHTLARRISATCRHILVPDCNAREIIQNFLDYVRWVWLAAVDFFLSGGRCIPRLDANLATPRSTITPFSIVNSFWKFSLWTASRDAMLSTEFQNDPTN